ncbi:lytic transglycosylase domain-containing protein [Vibrio sp. 10N.261.46.A3]|uniref:lytic transglycosylase domain-containing protein n=1 Tax=Vibrio sp. 10N.261.46.A3 TaxID=3229658 RepID=UPI0035531430
MVLITSTYAHSAPRSYSGWQSQGWTTSTATNALPQRCQRYCRIIQEASQRHGVPANLIVAVITQESRFKPEAVSPKGAKGLMQLMPVNYQGINPFEPQANIERGTRLLARLLKKYRDTALALAAYNAGEGNVRKYGGIPPFKETQHYVKRVMAHYSQLTG